MATLADMQALIQSMMQGWQQSTQTMISENNKAMIELMKTREAKGRIDIKSIGGPPEWDSTKDEAFLEWQIKIKAWLVNQDARALGWLKTARDMEGPVETQDFDLQECATETERKDCKKFNTLLYNILVTRLKGEALNLVSSVRDGCGFEA